MHVDDLKEHLFDDHERTIPVYFEGGYGDIYVNYDKMIELIKNKVYFIDHRRDYIYYTERTRDDLINFVGGSYRQEYIIDWIDEDKADDLLAEWKR